MASLSRKARLQKCCSWQVLDDLAFCSGRYPRLAELAAEARRAENNSVDKRIH